jgi:hypothetical protein
LLNRDAVARLREQHGGQFANPGGQRLWYRSRSHNPLAFADPSCTI